MTPKEQLEAAIEEFENEFDDSYEYFPVLLSALKEYVRIKPKFDEMKVLPEALNYFKPPFKYGLGQTIYCKNKHGDQMCLQVRGWGNLIGGGAHSLAVHDAEKIQDEFGQWVADCLTTCAAAL